MKPISWIVLSLTAFGASCVLSNPTATDSECQPGYKMDYATGICLEIDERAEKDSNDDWYFR